MKTILALLIVLLSSSVLQAQDGLPRYEIGTPDLLTIYIDPLLGNDSNPGTDAAAPMQTVDAAWRMIPMGTELQQGYRLLLAPGQYPAENLPTYWESRYGTYSAPILIESAQGAASVTLANVNLFDLRYVYFINLTFDSGADAFHCERCDHVLLRGSVLRGADPESYAVQETFKANQSRHIYLEDNDISGAWDNAVDMVAVQYGHVIGNRIHQAGDWCMYLKGGSGYFRVEANTFYDCGTGGFSAGQGTGFQYMVEPWIEYETYFVSFVNNLIYDTSGAGVGVQGGYNIIIAHNTIVRIGERSHILEVVYGLRSCDGEATDETRIRCEQYQQAGGWGNTLPFSEDNSVRIPSRHVFIVNNIFYNPAPFRSEYQHFTIFGPYTSSVQAESAVPLATTDENLVIAGNVIWNGDAAMPLGVDAGTGCADSNPTCNVAQLLADNWINTVEPLLVNAAQNDFRPTAALQALSPLEVPAFDLSDVPAGVPLPEPAAPVTLDWTGTVRTVPMIGALGQ